MHYLDSLLNSCIANPDDDLCRLVLADYMYESGELEKEAKIRNWIGMIKPRLKEMWESGNIKYGFNENGDRLFRSNVVCEFYRLLANDTGLHKYNNFIVSHELSYYGFDVPKYPLSLFYGGSPHRNVGAIINLIRQDMNGVMARSNRLRKIRLHVGIIQNWVEKNTTIRTTFFDQLIAILTNTCYLITLDRSRI